MGFRILQGNVYELVFGKREKHILATKLEYNINNIKKVTVCFWSFHFYVAEKLLEMIGPNTLINIPVHCNVVIHCRPIFIVIYFLQIKLKNTLVEISEMSYNQRQKMCIYKVQKNVVSIAGKNV